MLVINNIQNMTINPKFKSLIPPLAEEEYRQLEANIIQHGCRDALTVWRGILIDGHNRFAICTEHKIEYRTQLIDLPDEEAVEDWMDANQLGRRNLTGDQASILRGRRYNRMKKAQGEHKGNQHSERGQNDPLPKTADTLAKQHGVSSSTIKRDGKRAEALAKLAEVQPEAAQAVMDGTKRFNEVRREIKLEEVKKAVALPTAKYRVIYADPPWRYGDQLTENYGSVKFHYPSMTIKELCALPVREMTEPDAVLFMWVTSPLLFECAPIIDAWGFKYKTSFVWDKMKHNMGHYNSVRHEFLLVCTRGSCVPDERKLHDSVQSIERTTHSTKPEKFREIIQEIYPHGKRLEMFARKESDGWDVYGNQV